MLERCHGAACSRIGGEDAGRRGVVADGPGDGGTGHRFAAGVDEVAGGDGHRVDTGSGGFLVEVDLILVDGSRPVVGPDGIGIVIVDDRAVGSGDRYLAVGRGIVVGTVTDADDDMLERSHGAAGLGIGGEEAGRRSLVAQGVVEGERLVGTSGHEVVVIPCLVAEHARRNVDGVVAGVLLGGKHGVERDDGHIAVGGVSGERGGVRLALGAVVDRHGSGVDIDGLVGREADGRERLQGALVLGIYADADLGGGSLDDGVGEVHLAVLHLCIEAGTQ